MSEIKTLYGNTLADTVVREKLNAISDRLPAVYKSFAVGKQLQRYVVGYELYIGDDSSGTKAVNTTPVFFVERTLVNAPAGYKFFAAFVTSFTDYEVLSNTTNYVSRVWIEAGSYAFFQIKRSDEAALVPSDTLVINQWIDYGEKEFAESEKQILDTVISKAPIVYNSFILGQQIQTYVVGYILSYKSDSSNTRAVNTTPVYFPRKVFLAAPAGYTFFAAIITGPKNFTVISNTDSYIGHRWMAAGEYVIFQVKRSDGEELEESDLSVINNWINFQYKTFGHCGINRMCAAKKSFYDGTGSSFGNNSNNFTVAHLTDIHADVTRYANFRQFVDENADVVDCAILTGDYVDNQNAAQWTAMNAVTGNVNILQVVGNHDAGHQSGDTLLTDAELVEKYGITTATGKMYYKVDYDNGIRIIVLNQFEGSTRGTYVYNTDEITWLLSVLDDSIENSKHVIIACHIPDTFPVQNNSGFYQRYNKWYPQYSTMESGIEAIINAFRNGDSVSVTLSNNISVSHTFEAAGDFLCWMCGHYHGDFIGYSADYPDQLYLLGNGGVCTPLPFKSTNMGGTNSDLARIPRTPTEDCFNVYSFDLKKRLVKVVRIGASVNDMMQEREMTAFSLDGDEE